MKVPLSLILLASITFAGCGSSSYPGSSNYPNNGSTPYPYPETYPYPGPNQYPYPAPNQYPYPNGRRNNDVIVTRDGKVLDRNGRVVGTTRNTPPPPAGRVYGHENDRRYEEERRRNEEERRRNEEERRRREDHNDNRRYDKGNYEKGRDNGKHDDKDNWKNKRPERDNH